MKRRDAIKNISLAIGYTVSVPMAMEVLNACSKPQNAWNAGFLTGEEALLDALVDLILPPSETPGGLELNLPAFVDKMCKDLLTQEDQDLVSSGAKKFLAQLDAGEGGSGQFADQVSALFKKFFDLEDAEKWKVMQSQRKPLEEIQEGDEANYQIYKFLLAVRSFSLLGYFSAEQIGKEVLVFDPIPGGYQPCIPLEEVGNAWTI